MAETRDFATCHDRDGHHKRTYANKTEAKRAAKDTMARTGSAPLTAYKGDCGYWHIGAGTGYERTLEFNCSQSTADWISGTANLQQISMGELIRTAIDWYRHHLNERNLP